MEMRPLVGTPLQTCIVYVWCSKNTQFRSSGGSILDCASQQTTLLSQGPYIVQGQNESSTLCFFTFTQAHLLKYLFKQGNTQLLADLKGFLEVGVELIQYRREMQLVIFQFCIMWKEYCILTYVFYNMRYRGNLSNAQWLSDFLAKPVYLFQDCLIINRTFHSENNKG